jgi:hypothetical protein
MSSVIDADFTRLDADSIRLDADIISDVMIAALAGVLMTLAR